MSAPGAVALQTMDLGRPQAVVFDMDGLLLNTEALARLAHRAAGDACGLEVSDPFFASLIGVPADHSRVLLLARFGSAAPADRFFASATRALDDLIAAGGLQLRPGVNELLDALDAHGTPKAVATSSSRGKARHHLHAAGIDGRFDAIVTRDDVTCGKPFPDLFVHAAAALRTPADRCLALEDSYNGVRAAHAAGMPVVMVPDLLAPDDEMRALTVAIVPDLHAVVRWFDRATPSTT